MSRHQSLLSLSDNCERPIELEQQRAVPQPHTLANVGKPSSKPLIETSDLLCIVGLIACLVLAVTTIIPTSSLAWHLGFTNQIIIIGLLLGLMNRCLESLAKSALLLYEAQWGESTLQNYDAILTNSVVKYTLSIGQAAAKVGSDISNIEKRRIYS